MGDSNKENSVYIKKTDVSKEFSNVKLQNLIPLNHEQNEASDTISLSQTEDYKNASINSPIFPQKKGWIHMILGPMFSGKTSRLRKQLEDFSSGGNPKRCLLVTNNKDPKDDVISTKHEKFTVLKCSKLKAVMDDYSENFDIIAIDEAQFFPEIVEICEELANKGKKVLVAALDGTFQREEFGNVLKLIPKAETVKKLLAKCSFCGKKASFLLRVTNETETIVVDKSKYKAVCRTCYFLGMFKKQNLSGEESQETEVKDKAEESSDKDQPFNYK